MINIRAFESNFIEQLSRHMNAGHVGLIYLDIACFSRIEEMFGRLFCEQILASVKHIVQDLQAETPSLFSHKKVGNDFFLYVSLGRADASDGEDRLEQFGMTVKSTVEQKIQALYPQVNAFQLNIGYALLNGADQKDMDEIVYTAVKKAIGRTKSLAPSREHLGLLKEFSDILDRGTIHSVYQPIVSLSDGQIFGYEALTRGPEGSPFYSPLRLFHFAEMEGRLYALDQLAREKAIQGSSELPGTCKLFINIPSSVVHDPQFTPGKTMKILEQYGLTPHNVVFEITERSSIEDFLSTKKILEHYRRQGYQIAIDDAGAGYSSLQAIAELQPDYIKVDRSLIQNIHRDQIKEYILETFVSFAKKMNIRIIAEGIEQQDELNKLLRMGVHYAQGYLLGRPQPYLSGLRTEMQTYILNHKRNHWHAGGMWVIGDLAQSAKVVEGHAQVSEVAEYFKQEEREMGVVVADSEQTPIGLVMRENLFRNLADKYGVALYWNRNISRLMDSNPLIVDELTPLEQVSQMAMSRESKKLYDFVVITRENKYIGITSIQAILESITSIRMESAKIANPLTGLPGNLEIQRQIVRSIHEKKQFSVIYGDLDYFKWFNDKFGFNKGDQLIRYTAELIQQVLADRGEPNDFVGHIGGDDFIVLTSTDHPEQICEELIVRFDEGITPFYGERTELLDEVEDRSGNRVNARGVSLSLSLLKCNGSYQVALSPEYISHVAAEVKKAAKSKQGSVYVVQDVHSVN